MIIREKIKERILDKLKNVVDPELNINIVDLGLIYGIETKASEVYIKMTLTTPGCPYAQILEQEIKNELKKIKGIKSIKIELVWEPIWDANRLSDEAREKLGITY